MPDPPQLLAVTVLTSMDQAQVQAAGLERSPAEQVELLARMGLDAGISGFVCSPQEVAALRAITGPEGVLVIPGIRPAGGDKGDQKRIATPADALRQGASYLVVAGRLRRQSIRTERRRRFSKRWPRPSRDRNRREKARHCAGLFVVLQNFKGHLKFLVEVAC